MNQWKALFFLRFLFNVKKKKKEGESGRRKWKEKVCVISAMD